MNTHSPACSCHSHGISHGSNDEDNHDSGRLLLIRIIVSAVFLGISFLPILPSVAALIICAAGFAVAGYDVLWMMLKSLVRGQIFDENFLMSIASIGAIAIGELPEALGIMTFYQLGRYFEERAEGRSRRSINDLLALAPEEALLIGEDGKTFAVPPETVAVGARILVRPGERVALDGMIVSGSSSFDTSALTGESMPRDLTAGGEVFAGFINRDGAVTVEVTRHAEESMAARILDMVENASAKKAKAESFITVFSRYYTPVVVALAALLAIVPPLVIPGASFEDYIYRALTFLVVSCPCALVISVPMSFFAGIGAAAKRGILVKGGAVLDALVKVKTVVFDKTGTLTHGVFSLTKIVPADGISAEELLKTAAAAESASTHPIARSIITAYESAETLPPPRAENYRELAGLGVCCEVNGKTILAGNRRLMEENNIVLPDSETNLSAMVYIAEDGHYLGVIEVADVLKDGAAQALSELRSFGVKHMAVLTGDREDVTRKALNGLDFDEIKAGLLPDGKLTALEGIMSDTNGKTVFVGDGINDAPVIIRADVGMAMGAASSDAALEAADAVLLGGRPSSIADALRISRRIRRIVTENIVLSLGVKAAVLILGALGFANMWAAVAADVGVAIIAILNSLRALRAGE